MIEISELIVSSQNISLYLFPIAAITLTLLTIKYRMLSIFLLCIGVWLGAIGFYSLSYPMIEDYESLNTDGSGFFGSRWTGLTSFLNSMGILGEYIRLIGLLFLAYDVFSGKLITAPNKALKNRTAATRLGD